VGPRGGTLAAGPSRAWPLGGRLWVAGLVFA